LSGKWVGGESEEGREDLISGEGSATRREKGSDGDDKNGEDDGSEEGKSHDADYMKQPPGEGWNLL